MWLRELILQQIHFQGLYKKHQVSFVWVKGHANNLYNERCDQLAVEASKKSGLLEDTGYVTGI